MVEVRRVNVAGLELAMAMSDRLDALGSDATHAEMQTAIDEAAEVLAAFAAHKNEVTEGTGPWPN